MISVLCVDDDPAFLSLEKRCLEVPGVMTITTVLSAQEALEEMETNRFDAVVSAYQISDMNGIKLLKEVRAAYPGLPFILNTKKGEEEIIIEALNNGADFYLQKTGEPKIQFAKLKDTIFKAVKRGEFWQELHDSETRYRRLFETAQDGILILDVESGVITDANPFLLDLIGYTCDEMLGKKLWEIGFIKDKALAEQAAADLKRTGYIRYEDLPLETKDGRALDVEFVSNVYDVGAKKVILCNIRDITDRKRAEERQTRLASIVEYSDEAIIGKTLDGIITSWNTGAERIYGYSAQEIIGKNISLLIPSDHPDDTPTILEQIRKGIPVIRYETLRRKKDGGQINVALTVSPIKDAKNRVFGASTFAYDITERKRMEEAIRESEERYHTLAEASPDQIFIIGRDDTMKYANTAALKMFQLSYDQVIGTPRIDLFPPDIVDEQSNLLKKIFETGEQIRAEEKIQFGTKEFWIDTDLVPLKDKEGIVSSILGVARDITERKVAEETLKKFVADLDRQVIERTSDLSDVNLKLVTEISVRLDAEKQLTKSVGEKEVLLREVHHRVKNNLQIIISLLNLQSRYITDETTLSAFRESQNRIKAMALVHEKLYQSSDISKIDLENYIKFLGNNLISFFGVKGKGITLRMDIRDISIAIDTAIPIGLIMNELISNSLKYAFPDGREGEISLAIHRQNNTLTIVYKDNGIGIPQDFDWRNAKSLGLRLVIGLVEQLQGTIELDRTVGTAFNIVVKEKE